jgi:predicted small integral membrane protein
MDIWSLGHRRPYDVFDLCFFERTSRFCPCRVALRSERQRWTGMTASPHSDVALSTIFDGPWNAGPLYIHDLELCLISSLSAPSDTNFANGRWSLGLRRERSRLPCDAADSSFFKPPQVFMMGWSAWSSTTMINLTWFLVLLGPSALCDTNRIHLSTGIGFLRMKVTYRMLISQYQSSQCHVAGRVTSLVSHGMK